MVLFYSTFIVMKRQACSKTTIPRELQDDAELTRPRDEAEFLEFSEIITHKGKLHKLYLYTDLTSGVVRLEACAYRGPMKGTPIWTAFITKYLSDPDWAHWENGALVSLAAMKIPPYVFLLNYEPPKNEKNEYILQFETKTGMLTYVFLWTPMY